MECAFAVVNAKHCEELRYGVVPLNQHCYLIHEVIFQVLLVHAMNECVGLEEE
jgi:hypothetical protein